MTRVGPCRTFRKPRDLVTDAPCRTARPSQPRPGLVEQHRGPFAQRHTIAVVFQARSAFHRRVHSARPKTNARDETSQPPLMPWLSHLGSASDTHSHAGKRARPKLLTGFRRSSRATCRSSISAIDTIHKHNPDLFRPRRWSRWQAIARWVALFPEKHCQLGCHSSGVAAASSRLRNPHVDLLRQRGFTPNHLTQTPSVAR